MALINNTVMDSSTLPVFYVTVSNYCHQRATTAAATSNNSMPAVAITTANAFIYGRPM